MEKESNSTEQQCNKQNVSISKLSVGDKLYLNAGKDCPSWLHSFTGYITKLGRVRVKVRIPVDDDRERWISLTQLSLTDPWG